jgi:hypothetical protein
MQLHYTVIDQSGKQLFIRYPGGGRLPTSAFFSESSLPTYRLVPFVIASMIAALYAARSYGEVKSSTASSVSSSRFSEFCKLWIRTLWFAKSTISQTIHLEVLGLHELISEALKAAVTLGDFFGRASGQDKPVFFLADSNGGTSFLIQNRSPCNIYFLNLSQSLHLKPSIKAYNKISSKI